MGTPVFQEGNFKLAGRWSRDCVLHVEEPRLRSELKANRAKLKTTCPKAGVVESLSLDLEVFPSPKNPPIGPEISRVSPRIVLAHKEAVYQRLLLEAVTHSLPTEPVRRHA